MRRAIVLGALALAVVGLALWLRPAPGPAPTLSVARVGYWQTATVAGQPAAAVRAALRALGPRTAAPGDRGPRYAIQLASSRVLYDPEASALEVGTAWHRLPPLSAAAFGQAASDAESSFHGELVAWDMAQHLFPLRADALVVDYATGLRFWVRRLAGSAHA
ncbi:MAG TPA: hypothetical protein VNM16_04660, partial [Bacillota bacterium]|nr:hypothetical protein [Bacillota bacterium]